MPETFYDSGLLQIILGLLDKRLSIAINGSFHVCMAVILLFAKETRNIDAPKPRPKRRYDDKV